MLDDLFDYCFPILDKIGHKLDRIEDDMFEGAAEDVVRDISNVKQEIISYRKVIKPERTTLRVLERRIDRFLPEELELYFDDINDAVERIWDQLDNYKEVVEALESTNESVISHRQNDVLRCSRVISVTMLPLTLITGIFGMNVLYPRRGDARRLLGDPRRARRDARRRCSASSAGSAGFEDSCGLTARWRPSRPHRFMVDVLGDEDGEDADRLEGGEVACRSWLREGG